MRLVAYASICKVIKTLPFVSKVAVTDRRPMVRTLARKANVPVAGS